MGGVAVVAAVRPRLAGWPELSALSGRRYDHFSVLCELLPVGIPSLAVCLQSLLHGTVTAPPGRMGRGQRVQGRRPRAWTSLHSWSGRACHTWSATPAAASPGLRA